MTAGRIQQPAGGYYHVAVSSGLGPGFRSFSLCLSWLVTEAHLPEVLRAEGEVPAGPGPRVGAGGRSQSPRGAQAFRGGAGGPGGRLLAAGWRDVPGLAGLQHAEGLGWSHPRGQAGGGAGVPGGPQGARLLDSCVGGPGLGGRGPGGLARPCLAHSAWGTWGVHHELLDLVVKVLPELVEVLVLESEVAGVGMRRGRGWGVVGPSGFLKRSVGARGGRGSPGP